MSKIFTLKQWTGKAALLIGLTLAGSMLAWGQPDGFGGPPPDGQGPGQDQQQERPRGTNTERELKMLTKLLTLSADQQTAVKAILTDEHAQMEALFKSSRSQSTASSDGSATSTGTADANSTRPSREQMEAMRATIKTLRTATQTKIAALLSDTQKNTYAAYIEKREKAMAQRQQGGDGEMPPPPPDGGEGGPPPDGGAPGSGGPGGGGPEGI